MALIVADLSCEEMFMQMETCKTDTSTENSVEKAIEQCHLCAQELKKRADENPRWAPGHARAHEGKKTVLKTLRNEAKQKLTCMKVPYGRPGAPKCDLRTSTSPVLQVPSALCPI